MSSTSEADGSQMQEAAPSSRQLLSQHLAPTLKIGLLAGLAGTFYGAFSGILRVHRRPVLFMLTCGISSACMGTTYWATRSYLTEAWRLPSTRPRDDILATSIAAGASGLVGGLLKGKRRAVPYMLLFASLGAGGQYISDARLAPGPRSTDEEPLVLSSNEPKRSWRERWLPVKHLSDADYEAILLAKLEKINAEICNVDSKVELLNRDADVKAPAEQNQES